LERTPLKRCNREQSLDLLAKLMDSVNRIIDELETLYPDTGEVSGHRHRRPCAIGAGN
jgi:hypothetical protein